MLEKLKRNCCSCFPHSVCWIARARLKTLNANTATRAHARFRWKRGMLRLAFAAARVGVHSGRFAVLGRWYGWVAACAHLYIHKRDPLVEYTRERD